MPLKVDVKDFNWEEPENLHDEHLLDRVHNLITNTIQSPLTTSQNNAIKVFLFLLGGILGSVNVNIKPFDLRVETGLKIGKGIFY